MYVHTDVVTRPISQGPSLLSNTVPSVPLFSCYVDPLRFMILNSFNPRLYPYHHLFTDSSVRYKCRIFPKTILGPRQG